METHIIKRAFKRVLMPIMIGLLSIGVFSSCSDDDDDLTASQVPAQVSASFKKMFPSVKSPQWEMNASYYVADFNVNTFDTEAWYLSNGSWQMTSTDYDSMVNMLPIEISNAFDNSKYADWIVDDATLYERATDSFALIEVQTQGMNEIGLFYDTFGNLLNVVQGEDFDITPTTVVENITF